ncbi:hypothetical protein GGR52DRAFT_540713 [Hypoxylon sp. FL1284]|nr:hypothetical protein GGR52DRAFT_540713 [Hypoxylon sp. FL1284]
MAPPKVSKTSAEPTLYDVLSLTPKHLEGEASASQQKIVKQAYRRALLTHHPDKAASKDNEPASSSSSSSPPSQAPSASTPTSSPAPKPKKPQRQQKQKKQPRILYTVDQIQHAYGVLSDRKQRAEYDRSLRAASSSSGHLATSSSSSAFFHTGVETVDLDDVAFDERKGVYHRPCRCGNARGYAFTEDNLDEFEDDGVLMVECLDCSLWIRVLFAAAEEEEDDDANDVARNGNSGGGGIATGKEAAVAPAKNDGGAVTRGGQRRGSGAGRGFTFNWSFNWGISLSGSATVGNGGSRR